MTDAQERLLAYCLTKPGAYVDYPFGPDSTIVKVRAEGKTRIFAQLFDLYGEPKATFNCDAMTGDFYRALYPGAVTRGYHCPPVQQPYFNTVSLDGAVLSDELLNMIDHAYTFVLSKLPCAARAALEQTCNVKEILT